MQVVDILLVIGIIFIIYKFLKKTEGLRVAAAIFAVYLLNFASFALGLEHTTDLLNKIVSFLLLASAMIFYPEMRLFFKKIIGARGSKKPSNIVLKNIETTLFELSKEKVGALIILDEEGYVGSAAENGVYIDAKADEKLLRTIFNPATVMHDGAVIITNGRIKYASCKLPLTAKNRTDFGTLGTRHMVAIETAENFECTVFVVSEETGSIRIATKNGFHFISNKKEFNDFFNARNKG